MWEDLWGLTLGGQKLTALLPLHVELSFKSLSGGGGWRFNVSLSGHCQDTLTRLAWSNKGTKQQEHSSDDTA